MIRGTLVHEQKEQSFLEKAELITWKDFLESEKLAVTKEFFLSSKIGDVNLLGKIDEIAIDKDSIHIIDDKPRAYPYDSTKRQIFAYCYMFKDNFKSKKQLYATLRDRDTNEIKWKQEFDPNLEKEFFLAFHRIRKILLKQEEPIPTTNPKKCMACQFNKICEKSLVK